MENLLVVVNNVVAMKQWQKQQLSYNKNVSVTNFLLKI